MILREHLCYLTSYIVNGVAAKLLVRQHILEITFQNMLSHQKRACEIARLFVV